MNERFAKVREILSEPPSEAAWDTLLQELRAWPSFDDKEMGIEYLDAHLAMWPDELRALNQLNESPYWRFIRCYHVDQKMKNTTLQRRLKTHPMLKDITTLRLSIGGHVDQLLPSICFSKKLSNLHTLILENRAFGHDLYYKALEVLDHLSDQTHSHELQHLRMTNVLDGITALKGLALFPNMASLETLEIEVDPYDHRRSSTSMGFTYEEEGYRALFVNDVFPQLKVLRLTRCEPPAAFLADFSRRGLAEHLETLAFKDCALTTEHIEALVSDDSSCAMKTLWFEACQLSTKALHALAEARCFDGTTVELRGNEIHRQTEGWLKRRAEAYDGKGPQIRF